MSGAFRASSATRADIATELLLRMSRLADPAYQAMSARITEKLDHMDEASVIALQEIEEEIREIARERERLRERAYRDERGRRMFMTEDESAAYYEDGSRLGDDKLAIHKERLRGHTSWKEWERLGSRRQDLEIERDQIHAHDTERDRLREDLAEGRIPTEQAEQRERAIEDAMPARVRRIYAPAQAAPDPDPQAATPGRHHPAPDPFAPQP
jgi:hypothetical protein